MSRDESVNAATADEQSVPGDPAASAADVDRLEREALRLLRIRDGTLQLEELAAGIAALDDEVERANEQRLRIQLHHRHVPKLDDRGLVSFEPSSGRVALTEDGTRQEVTGSRGFHEGSVTFGHTDR